MSWTAQMKALAEVQRIFGKSGYTEDHLHFRRVGCRRKGQTWTANGDTWDEAIQALQGKVQSA